MAENNYFSHQSPTYGSAFDMMQSAGVSYRSAGENIARGQKTPAAVMDSWMNSQGHRENILSSRTRPSAWDMRWMTAEEPAGFRFSKDRQTGDGRQTGRMGEIGRGKESLGIQYTEYSKRYPQIRVRLLLRICRKSEYSARKNIQLKALTN